jgi:hypothetical protein
LRYKIAYEQNRLPINSFSHQNPRNDRTGSKNTVKYLSQTQEIFSRKPKNGGDISFKNIANNLSEGTSQIGSIHPVSAG